MGQLLQGLEKHLLAQHTPKTVKRYLWSVGKYLECLGEDKARKASYSGVLAYIGALREAGHAASHLRTELFAIRKFHGYLTHTGERFDDPTMGITLQDLPKRQIEPANLFSTQELETVVANRAERYPQLKYRNLSILGCFIYQGMTTGEMAALRTGDIDLEEGSVSIAATTRTLSRTLPLQPKQAVHLDRYLRLERPKLVKDSTQHLWITKLGKPELGDGLHYLVSTAKHLFPGRDLNPRTIRQSVIRNRFLDGLDIREVQLFAGHRYPSATEKYRPTDNKGLLETVRKCHPLEGMG
jgi:integrase/recombinase XerD